MNEKYVSYYKWKKLSKDDRDEFKYKFESNIIDILNDVNRLPSLLLKAFSVSAILFIAGVLGKALLDRNISSLVNLIFLAFAIPLTVAVFSIIRESYIKYKINKWLESKGL